MRQRLQEAMPGVTVHWISDSHDSTAQAALSSSQLVYACARTIDTVPGQPAVAVPFAQQLALLRDRCCDVLIVEELAANPRLLAVEYFALGFRHQALPEAADSHLSLYAYSLRDYKTQPDWLNAQFWAHPERWDKPT